MREALKSFTRQSSTSRGWKTKRMSVRTIGRLVCFSLLTASPGEAKTGNGDRPDCRNPYNNLPCNMFDRTMSPSELLHFQNPPTISPTDPPTVALSTATPTLATTVAPTAQPTAKRTTLPPTLAPTDNNILVPASGDGSPAAPETSTPTTTEADPLLVSDCRAVDGVYGDITAEPLFVDFRYELETDAAQQADVENDLLPLLENAFVNYVLKDMFPGECQPSSSSSRRQLQLTHGRRLEFLGISGRPADTVSANSVCVEVLLAGSDCSVIDGEITLYSDARRILTTEDTLRESLRAGMGSGDFLSVHPAITRVSYVEADPDSDTRGTVESPGEDDDDDNDKGLRVGLLVGAAAALLLGMIVIARAAKQPTGGNQPPEQERNSLAEAA